MDDLSYTELIRRDLRSRHCEYGTDALTSHALSALVALHALGMDCHALAWYSRYERR
jgi:hypothetical protein